jgi:transposase-like protein
MKAERKAFLKQDDTPDNKANGYYCRGWDCRYGCIQDLEVPRDRQNQFQTKAFEPNQRREGWLERLVTQLYANGVRTREIVDILDKLYGQQYSAGTISNITEIVVDDIDDWQSRKLKSRYSVVYLDATVLDVRRDRVDNEALYVLAGVNEEGYRELLGFYLGGNESSTVWRDLVEDIKQRGVEEVLLFVSDDLPGLADQLTEAFPRADHQPCVVHKVRNTLNKVRKKHQDEMAEDLKDIYKVQDHKTAKKALKKLRSKWQATYPKIVASWEDNIDRLLTFLDYPAAIQSVIYTTNWIEAALKQIKDRTHKIGSLPSPKAARKIVYLKATDMNDRWSNQRLRGFKKARRDLLELFEERYPSDTQTQ